MVFHYIRHHLFCVQSKGFSCCVTRKERRTPRGNPIKLVTCQNCNTRLSFVDYQSNELANYCLVLRSIQPGLFPDYSSVNTETSQVSPELFIPLIHMSVNVNRNYSVLVVMHYTIPLQRLKSKSLL